MLNREEMEEREQSISKSLDPIFMPDDLDNSKNRIKVYPEYTFMKPYAIWTGGIPIYALFPFYKQLIVHLDPIINRDEFYRVYGMSIEDFTTLKEYGRLIVLLRSNYKYYPEYYDILLGSHIPRNNRFENFYLSGLGKRIESYGDLIRTKRFSHNEDIPQVLKKALLVKYIDSDIREIFIQILAMRMAKLSIIGLESKTLEIIEQDDLTTIYERLHSLNRAFAVPYIDALGGWDNLDFDHLELLSHEPSIRPEKKQLILPKELLLWLNEKLEYSYPETNLEKKLVEVIEKSDEIKLNHVILEKLQNEFDVLNIEQTIKLAKESKELIKKIQKNIFKIEDTRAKIRKYVTRPISYACNVVSKGSYALMGKFIASGQIPEAASSGAIGVGVDVLKDKLSYIESFITSLRHGGNNVSTIIWAKIKEQS